MLTTDVQFSLFEAKIIYLGWSVSRDLNVSHFRRKNCKYMEWSSLAEESFQLLFHIILVLEAISCQEVQYCIYNQNYLH